MIEQLHYTWAENGLTGQGGQFQVTAASPGLSDLGCPAAALANKFCRWSPGPSGDAVSYGWYDARGSRVVFLRVGAGRTGDNRPGNFAAHVLLAPAGLITMDQLLAPADPDTWWDGGQERSTRLPRLSAGGLGLLPRRPYLNRDEPTADESPVADVIAQLLAHRLTGHVSANWDALLAALVATGKALPHALAALPSFSSFETGESKRWFRLVGTGRAAPVQSRLPRPVYGAARLIASVTPTAMRCARAAGEATWTEQGQQWLQFAALAAALEAVQVDGAVDRADLIPALANAGTAYEVLLHDRARHEIAGWLTLGHEDVCNALDSARARLDSQLLHTLGAEMARYHLQRNPDGNDAAWAVAVRSATRLGEPALTGLAEVALAASVSVSEAWTPALALVALRSRALQSDTVTVLLQTVLSGGPASVRALIGDPRVAATHRAVLLYSAARGDVLAPAEVGRWLTQQPALCQVALPGLAEADRLLAVLRTLSPEIAGQILVAGTARLSPPTLFQATAETAARLPPTQAHRLIQRARTRVDSGWHSSELRAGERTAGVTTPLALRRPDGTVRAGAGNGPDHSREEEDRSARSASRSVPPDWMRLEDVVLVRAVRGQLDRREACLAPWLLMRLCSRSSFGLAWRALLGAVDGASAHGSASNMRSVADALTSPALAANALAAHQPGYVESDLAREYAVQASLAGVQDWTHLAFVVSVVGGSMDDDVLTWCLAAAYRTAMGRGDFSLAIAVLALVAERCETRQVLENAAVVAAALDDDRWTALERYLSGSGASGSTRRRLSTIRKLSLGRPVRRLPHPSRHFR